ncbi:hypothetical protein EJB05_49427, partial [Eragrostis curvula]
WRRWPRLCPCTHGGGGDGRGVEIYPLSRYYFGAKDAAAVPRGLETAADRALRLKANFAAHGLRTSVHGVLLVELFDHPHVLLLQVRNSSFVLPGGRLRPSEADVQGLKRKLSSKLSVVRGDGEDTTEDVDDWQECIKLFLIRLPMSRRFVVPRNMKLLAVPLSQIHGNAQVYGPIISGIPNLLSKFSFQCHQ